MIECIHKPQLTGRMMIYCDDHFRKMVSEFDIKNQSYYTDQLKSSKGIVVAMKGTGPDRDLDETKFTTIYNLRYLLHRRITVPELRKRIPEKRFQLCHVTISETELQRTNLLNVCTTIHDTKPKGRRSIYALNAYHKEGNLKHAWQTYVPQG